jgi:hypothetical protein
MNAPSKVLPSEWVERLFLRFQAIYGNNAVRMWGDADQDEVKLAWSQELADFDGADIRWALEALRTIYVDFPPTLFQFAALCRDGRRSRMQSVPKLMPPPNKAAVDRMAQQVSEVGTGKRDPKAWARKIVERPGNYPPISLAFAREALGLTEREPGCDDA